MELVVFDLDGTLLNRDSVISEYTSETLRLLEERNIAYTVATGRTLHGARAVLEGHSFQLPQVYKNGVLIWHPDSELLKSGATLTSDELHAVVGACKAEDITPFVSTLDEDHESTVYHSEIRSDIALKLAGSISISEHKRVRTLEELPNDATVTHVNSIGDPAAIEAVLRSINDVPNIVAYSGIAWEGEKWRWLDIHHSDASKGGAITMMRDLLGLKSVICFGDSENDLSMFAAADESYAPANAKDSVKAAATAVIGHHDEDGIARFLRERFGLDA